MILQNSYKFFHPQDHPVRFVPIPEILSDIERFLRSDFLHLIENEIILFGIRLGKRKSNF